MEIRVLRYFLTVVREENITRAAEVLHITQPTLSRQLAQLETQMGVKLFLRGARKIVLTEEGLLLRRRAEEILELVDKTEHELTGQDGKIEGTVSIGCGDLKAVEELAELIRTFHEQYPLVTFDLYTASADYVRDRMDRGLTDIGLLLEPVDLGKYDYIRMAGEERCVVTMHPDAPLHVLFTSNLPSSSLIMSNHHLAYSMNICGSISCWDKTKITYRPLRPGLTATCALAWKRQQPFGAAAEKFISHVKERLLKQE